MKMAIKVNAVKTVIIFKRKKMADIKLSTIEKVKYQNLYNAYSIFSTFLACLFVCSFVLVLI